jgi:putative hemolysin
VDPDPYPILSQLHIILLLLKPFTAGAGFFILLALVFLFAVSLFSAVEVAFFALGPQEIEKLKSEEGRRSQIILAMLDRPKRLLATVLVGINLLNIGIVIISNFIMATLFDFSSHPLTGFLIQVIVVTFLILLVGEVIPKVYSANHPLNTVKLLAFPLLIVERLLWPISSLLMLSTSFFDRKIRKKEHFISVDELSQALELTTDQSTPETEKKLLKGIVRFGNMDVKQIMKARPDIVAVDHQMPFHTLLEKIRQAGFSRMPVYRESMDRIIGVLHVKDLLGYLDRDNGFAWQTLVREPFFVPETKMIDDLLREFQGKKIHLAVVVDEYGGTSGVVTLEDVIEEIVGEINDEFDDDDIVYSKLDDFNFVFEGKILLSDLCRIIGIEGDTFENVKGESDTLAGFILEYTGRIPSKNEQIKMHDFIFTIESADNRKIKRVKVTLPKDD